MFNRFITPFFNCIVAVFLSAITVSIIGMNHGESYTWNIANVFSNTLIIIFFALFVYLIYYIIKKNIKNNNMLTTFIVIGFILRVLWIIFIPTIPKSDYKTMYDSAVVFAHWKTTMFNTGTYFHRFPHLTGYVLLLGSAFKIFGGKIIVYKIFNVICSTICIFLSYLIVKKISTRNAANIAAFFTAVFPPLIYYTSVAATETVAIPLFMLSIYLLIKAYKHKKSNMTLFYITISGIVLSLASFLRGVGVFFLVAYLIFILIGFGRRIKMKSIVALLLSFVIIFFTIDSCLYNSETTKFHLFNGATPISISVLNGLNFETNGTYSDQDHQLYEKNKGDKDKINAEAISMIKERLNNKGKILPFFANKTAILWGDGDFGGNYWAYYQGTDGDLASKTNVFYKISQLIYLFLLILTIIGLYMGRKHRSLVLFSLIILSFECAFMLLEVQSRYIYIISFMFIILASIGFDYIMNFRPKQKIRLK